MQQRTAWDPQVRTVPSTASHDGSPRWTRRIVLTLGVGSALLSVLVSVLAGSIRPAGASPAGVSPGAGSPGGADTSYVAVIKVSGLLDPVLVDFLEDQISTAEKDNAVVVLLQINSPGAAVSEARLQRLVDRIRNAKVPVAIWVGPSGARVRGRATDLLAAADVVALAHGSRVVLPGGRSYSSEQAVEAGIADLGGERAATIVITLGELRDLGIPVETRVVGQGDHRTRELVTQVRFGQLGLTGRLLHTIASPAVAYLLFVIGLALLVFELYTAGVGVAGLVGAACLLLGSYGLAVLPTRPVAVALLLLAMFGYAIDVQTGVPRAWTAIATIALVAGSLLIYDGLSVSWITLVMAIAGMTLAMLAGMPAMVRARFSTPTIGREWMIGELGEAAADVAPNGVVTVRDAPWRARTNRATPIQRGDRIRVVAIDGLVLEVEPEEGAARDYRDRAKSH
jgi:membrane-bound serine protease (ClpP class)